MANPQHLMPNTQHPPLAITLCELCMPEAFCGLETVSLKPPWPPCSLWEKKICSIKEKPPQRLSSAFYFSQIYTEEQNSQGSERWWPLPLPLPQREGRDYRDTPITRVYASVYPHIGSPIGVTSHFTPLPTGEGPGEGPLSHGIETVRKKGLLNLCVLWEKELPSVSEKTPTPHASSPIGATSHTISLSETSQQGDKKPLQSTKLATLTTRRYHCLQPRI